MATDGTIDFDSLPESESHDGGSTGPKFVSLDKPGDEIAGELAYREYNVGENNSTIICLRVGPSQYVKHWASGQVLGVLKRENAELGDVVGIRMTEETDSFEQNGEEIEYNVIETRVDKSHRMGDE